jgi:hypothetical protein
MSHLERVVLYEYLRLLYVQDEIHSWVLIVFIGDSQEAVTLDTCEID